MNKFFLNILYLSIALLSFSSCTDDDDDDGGGAIVTTGAYILNTGTWGNSDAMLSYLDIEKGTLTTDLFGKVNSGKRLGDMAEDIIVYGSKLYVTVTESNVIYILDKDGKIVKEPIKPLNTSGQPLKPRSLVAHGGSVYVSMYGGYVGRIDTTELTMDAKVKVGPYPEQMAVANNKLYVALASRIFEGIISKSVSVININEFKTAETKEVGLNPSNVVSDSKGNVYVACLGDFGDIKSAIKKIDTAGNVTEITTGNLMAIDGSKLYIVHTSSDPEDWSANKVEFSWYDINKGELHAESFIKAEGDVASALDLTKTFSVDPASKAFYFLTSPYGANGDLYVFSASGIYQKKIDTGGLFPNKIAFLKK